MPFLCALPVVIMRSFSSPLEITIPLSQAEYGILKMGHHLPVEVYANSSSIGTSVRIRSCLS